MVFKTTFLKRGLPCRCMWSTQELHNPTLYKRLYLPILYFYEFSYQLNSNITRLRRTWLHLTYRSCICLYTKTDNNMACNKSGPFRTEIWNSLMLCTKTKHNIENETFIAGLPLFHIKNFFIITKRNICFEFNFFRTKPITSDPPRINAI